MLRFKNGSKETIRTRNDGDSDEGESNGHSEKWLDFGYTLKDFRVDCMGEGEKQVEEWGIYQLNWERLENKEFGGNQMFSLDILSLRRLLTS